MPELRTAAGSHIGRRYWANFDVVHLGVDPLLAVVADGMGDGRGSALAGRTTVDTIVARLTGAEITPSAIRDAVAEAQLRVRAIAQEIGELTGCTLTAMAAAQTVCGSPRSVTLARTDCVAGCLSCSRRTTPWRGWVRSTAGFRSIRGKPRRRATT